MPRHFVRRGIANVQWAVVAALVFLAIVAGVTVLGSRTNTRMNQVSTDVTDPAALTQRFGSQPNQGDQ
jgi:Flp pilus assembly pilin Flp